MVVSIDKANSHNRNKIYSQFDGLRECMVVCKICFSSLFSGARNISCYVVFRHFWYGILAELLCGRRPREWSPILILRGALVIFYGQWHAEWLAGACAVLPNVRPSHFMTFLHEVIFAQCNANALARNRASLWLGKLDVSFALAKETRLPVPNTY